MAEWLGIGAALWGVLMALSPVLQIRRITLRRSSGRVLAYLAVLQVGFCLWVAYGLALANPIIAVPNLTAAVVGVVTMAISWRYRNAAER